MKRLKAFILMVCLVIPFVLVGCDNVNKDTLSTPNEIYVESGGLVNFARVDNADYYVVNINDVEINVFTNSNYVNLYSNNGVNYVEYDAGRMFTLGESYTIKVKACGEDKKDSGYSDTYSYIHRIPMAKPDGVKINETTLTWDVVENASFYLVKVITPADNIEKDDTETVSAADLTTYQFSSNKFDFDSILSLAGNYKFYINAVSYDSLYTESGYTNKITYKNNLKLATPSGANIYKTVEYDDNLDRYVDNLHLVSVVDTNANALTVRCGDYVASIELTKSLQLFTMEDDVIDINLNKLFKDVKVNGQSIDFNQMGQYTFTISSQYITYNENDKFYLDSEESDILIYESKLQLSAPAIEITYDTDGGFYIAKWSTTPEEQDFVSGYVLYIATDAGIEMFEYSNEVTSKILDNYCSVSIQAIIVQNFTGYFI